MIALIYTRVSSDEQAKDGLSLPAQLQACRRYCGERGWLIAGEYEDVLTGTRDDRPRYQELLLEARRLSAGGKSVAVVVARLDRFGRRLMERIRSREEFRALNVTTHSVREGGEVSDLMANMLAVMAQEEVERLGDRVRDTRQHNSANGWHTPGRTAWGYRLREATPGERAAGAPKSVLTIDDATAPYVAEMFRMVASGEASPRSVAGWVAGLSEEARGGRGLNPSAVRMLLGSPVYVGRFEDGQPGRWEPLIDEPTWQAVQTRLTNASGRSGPVSGAHLLTGMLRCPRCDSGMAGWTQKTPGGTSYRRYRCNGFVAGGERSRRDCTFTVLSEKLDGAVLRQVADLLAPVAEDNPALRASIGRAWERLRKPNDAVAKERARMAARARKDEADARRRIADAARLLVDGTIDRTAYAALAAEERVRLESAERTLSMPEIAATTSALPPLADVLALVGGWTTVLSSGPIPEQRTMLMMLIEHVVPRRVGFGRYTAEITWTELGKALQEMPVAA
jgi:DNA invertase Pin-like site-specific DNA recombinase